MQLSKIKLAGFKSFVDPTTIMLPGKMVAIVGPNGCGKSNIIDAVSWVMGESSPKYLRGESLTDVIFNGSTARKPVGQASVELIFDNQDGTLGGEYAKYAEIAIKRVLSREGDAAYYLNGVRCRKRDVVDIFLGTGLGPRSYSIIGQNMISRIIEAKPDDMRTYLEEAAGISKYKERRHETGLRMRHTRENIDRVNDLRTELEKQLSHLKNQANVAERFKTLKQQERILKSQWYACQWRELDSGIVSYSLQIQKEETALEGKHTEMSHIERELMLRRDEQQQTQETFQEVQKRYYAVGNEITRIEQDILHHQEKRQQWENDLHHANQDWEGVKTHLEEMLDNLQKSATAIENLEPDYVEAKRLAETLENQLDAAEEDAQTWQAQWDAFNQDAAKMTQTAQVEKNHIQHIEQKIAFIKKREQQVLEEQNRIDFSQINKEVSDFSHQSDEVKESLQLQDQALTMLRTELSQLQVADREAHKELDKVRSELQQLKGQQASLTALQQTALGQRDNRTAPWVTKQGLEKNARLAQNIEVEAGWELALEKVLGAALQAIRIEHMSDVLPHLESFTQGNLCLYTGESSPTNSQQAFKGTLLVEKIKSKESLQSLLSGIYIASSLPDALTLCEVLEAHESVITQQGIWLNRAWIKVFREDNPAAGVFQREQELKQLEKKIVILQTSQHKLEADIAERRTRMTQLEKERDQLQQQYNQKQAQSAQIHAQKKAKEERLIELNTQAERCAKELTELAAQCKQAEVELNKARSLWQEALTGLEGQAKERGRLVTERDEARRELQALRQQSENHKDHLHELEMSLQTHRAQKISLQQNITRMQTQLTALTERKDHLQQELNAMPRVDSLKESLANTLDKHVKVEEELNLARNVVEALEQALRQLEEKRHACERDANKTRHTLESLRLHCQSLKVKADLVMEQIKETEFLLEDVLKELPPEVTVAECQASHEQVVQRIQRLGAINLVAIEEYATCLERKEYLDTQLQDLQDGLKILEDAIAKIDRETRTRFKDTFDKVNDRFQELFPSIFGGGRAYLELIDDNLLETGVTVMACPPGKRNSTIHLLSGGEKALTAIALIFSIFHLNPAPFCLLDEVDAPLDDANVIRFCKLVSEMAGKTQFFFISHNKVTIGMAEHLIGVTMHEPGVSRLVSVDIEQAMSLAGVE